MTYKLLFGSVLRKFNFLQHDLFILQIKQIDFFDINIDENWAHLVGKCISNDGEMTFKRCQITKHASKTLCVALGDKHVRIS